MYSFSEVLVVTVCSLVIGVFACFSVFVLFSGGKNYFILSKDRSKAGKTLPAHGLYLIEVYY